MKCIKEGTEFLDQLKDRVHDLYDENKELKQEIERLNDYISFYEDLSKKQNKEIERLNNIIDKALKYIETWGYNEYELFRIDEHEPNFTTGEDVITIVETLENILKGVDKE